MHSSKGCLVLLLVTVCLHSSLVLGDGFAWSDCGVQLTKDIHYVSASISPSTIGASGPLSINVQATITSKIYNSDTQLVVYKDGDLYLDVGIQDLCTIVSTTTKSISCPLPVGPISITYTFQTLPILPVGDYTFQIRHKDLGCLQLSGTAGSLIGTSNFQTSAFTVSLAGTPTFSNAASARKAGDTITLSNGQFKGSLVATTDLGGTQDLSKYSWQLNGALPVNPVLNGSLLTMMYTGSFGVSSAAEQLMQGSFNLTLAVDQSTQAETLTGHFTPNPVYSFSSNFTYPIVLGNLAPFQVVRQQDNSIVVSGSRKWCTAGVDRCNVCGGDGSSCGVAATPKSTKLADKQVAAIVIGVVGGVLGLIAVVFLAMMLRRERKAPRYDDADLIDHPQKPDYGTMAIDDIMREGERATY